jgi:hypothetical protein
MLPEVVVVTRTPELASPQAVVDLERTLGTDMPAGNDALVTTCGQGTFCNELNLWGPERVLDNVDRSREMWEEFWFWDDAVTSQPEMRAAVPLGDSSNGDQLALVPGKGLVFLPRDEDLAIGVGTSMVDAVTWFCGSGTLVAPHEVLWFESWAEPATYENWSGGALADARNAVADLGRHVAEDHDADRGTSTFLVPAMGGHLSLAALEGWDGIYAHLRYLPDLSGTADDLARALESAGMSRQSRWGEEPAG